MKKFWQELSGVEKFTVAVSLGWVLAFINWVYWLTRYFGGP